jgi:hypothetical protein
VVCFQSVKCRSRARYLRDYRRLWQTDCRFRYGHRVGLMAVACASVPLSLWQIGLANPPQKGFRNSVTAVSMMQLHLHGANRPAG